MAANRAGEKSAAAFRTISEVSNELQVPQHVLRFWETKFNEVRPMKRGGGRRYYRPEDIELLRRVRDLLYSDGYTIKGVQKLLREGQVGPGRAGTGTAEKPPAAGAKNARQARGGDASTPSRAGLDERQRKLLQEILDELTALRDQLRDDGG